MEQALNETIVEGNEFDIYKENMREGGQLIPYWL